MMENKNTPPYQLTMTNREYLQAGGIIEVESFDEHQVIAGSHLGPLVIKGEGLHIIQLDLEEGKMVIAGEIGSVQYIENRKAKLKNRGKGVLERLFK